MLLRFHALGIASVWLVGCGGNPIKPPPSPCVQGFVGDPSKPPELSLLVTDGKTGLLPVGSGDALPLVVPPQGGLVLYIGARARNLDSCSLEIEGQLRDPQTGDAFGFDRRPTYLIAGASGWGTTEAIESNSNVANVFACPDIGAKDVQGQSYVLEVKLVDSARRTAMISVPIVPSCLASDPAARASCICLCSANFVPGKCG